MQLLRAMRGDNEIWSNLAHHAHEASQRVIAAPLTKRLGSSAPIAAIRTVEVINGPVKLTAPSLGFKRADPFKGVTGLRTTTVLPTAAAGHNQHGNAHAEHKTQIDGRQEIAVIGMRRDQERERIGACIEHRLTHFNDAAATAPLQLLPALRKCGARSAGDRNQKRAEEAHRVAEFHYRHITQNGAFNHLVTRAVCDALPRGSEPAHADADSDHDGPDDT